MLVAKHALPRLHHFHLQLFGSLVMSIAVQGHGTFPGKIYSLRVIIPLTMRQSIPCVRKQPSPLASIAVIVVWKHAE